MFGEAVVAFLDTTSLYFEGRGGATLGQRLYREAVREALIVPWEASDRVCGKRLRVLAPILVEAMERHGHLQLAPEVRAGLLRMSAATIDRAGSVRNSVCEWHSG